MFLHAVKLDSCSGGPLPLKVFAQTYRFADSSICIAGAVKYLQQRFDIERWQMRGASAGALVATLAACNVNSEVAFESAHRLSVENKLFERPLGLAGVL